MEYIAEELGIQYSGCRSSSGALSLRADLAAILGLRRLLRRATPRHPPYPHGEGGRPAGWQPPVGRRRPRVIVHTYHGHVSAATSPAPRNAFPGGRARSRVRDRHAHRRQQRGARRFVGIRVAAAIGSRSSHYGSIAAERVEADDRARERSGPGSARRDTFVIGWAGRTDRDQASTRLIRVLAVLDQGSRALVLSATASSAVPTEALARDLGVAEQMAFRSAFTSGPRVVRGADVSLLTSLNEGTPVVAIESLSAGVPGRGDPRGRLRRPSSQGRDAATSRSATSTPCPHLDRLALRPALRGSGSSAARPTYAPVSRSARMADDPRRRVRTAARGDEVLHLHKLTGVGDRAATSSHFSRAPDDGASTPASSGSTRRSTDARAVLSSGSNSAGVPYRVPRARSTSPRDWRATPSARPRRNSPTSLHTHLVHGGRLRLDRRDADCARPSSRRATTTTGTCSGPFRYVDRAFARPAPRLIAISDAVRRFLERQVTPRKLTDDPLRPRPDCRRHPSVPHLRWPRPHRPARSSPSAA